MQTQLRSLFVTILEKCADDPCDRIIDFPSSSSLSITPTLPSDPAWVSLGLIPLASIEETYRTNSRLSRHDARFSMESVVAPAIDAICSDRAFVNDQLERFDPLFSAAFFGLPSHLPNEATAIVRYESLLPAFSPAGVLAKSSVAQRPFPSMHVPQLRKLILDSGKLAKLDQLLAELKTGGHRVLLYFQMTRMIDLMEEYLAFRQFKYLRLDGSSTISERRDMVMDWQTKFVFLPSRDEEFELTFFRADRNCSSSFCRRELEDWESILPPLIQSSSTTRIGIPRFVIVRFRIRIETDLLSQNDLQAMDRAHRLGQTKQVTVYRMITKGTVDERILELARFVVRSFFLVLTHADASHDREKKLVQDAVVGSSSANAGESSAPQTKTNEVMSLLLGQDELEEGLRQAEAKRKRLELKQIENGKKGASTRVDNKKLREEAIIFAREEEERKKALGGSSWYPEDEEGTFFVSFRKERKVD